MAFPHIMIPFYNRFLQEKGVHVCGFICDINDSFSWGTADLFYKKRCWQQGQVQHNKNQCHGRPLSWAFTASCTCLSRGIEFDPLDMVNTFRYPFLHILSMLIGYLRATLPGAVHILSVPNSSGVLTPIALIIMFPKEIGVLNTVESFNNRRRHWSFHTWKEAQTETMELEKAKINPKYQIGVLCPYFP